MTASFSLGRIEQALIEAFGNSDSEMIPLGHNQIVIVKGHKPYQN
jgi:hypothetical protein